MPETFRRPKLGNPIKSEASAFRWLVLVLALGALVVIVTVLTRPRVGALLGLAIVIVALVLGVRASWRWLKRSEAEQLRAGERDERER